MTVGGGGRMRHKAPPPPLTLRLLLLLRRRLRSSEDPSKGPDLRAAGVQAGYHPPFSVAPPPRFGAVSKAPHWRSTSNTMTEEAEATFSEFFSPKVGISTMKSHSSRTAVSTPVTSLPRIKAVDSGKETSA
eukprot:CAMPEP_0185773038 /NCGR_PEP_ID=MMETSP1174-20130828/72251_1 /TAXON_ID=35687 /ORGANISM="Dictyocha speculum, Strain CCMP1381" /LENGTH=130 /DNA_ID=CAMNT_0028459573 /DNA_START=327 /DNA_END=720 /DNA_ORIENTATION=+